MRRDEGDAGAHRRGAPTPQTAPRRRNRLRWLAFCSRLVCRDEISDQVGFPCITDCKRPDTTSASIFQQPASRLLKKAAREAGVYPRTTSIVWVSPSDTRGISGVVQG